jgi:hypothetical protein
MTTFNVYERKGNKIERRIYEMRGTPPDITISNVSGELKVFGYNINGKRVDSELIYIENDVCIMKYNEATDMFETINK